MVGLVIEAREGRVRMFVSACVGHCDFAACLLPEARRRRRVVTFMLFIKTRRRRRGDMHGSFGCCR